MKPPLSIKAMVRLAGVGHKVPAPASIERKAKSMPDNLCVMTRESDSSDLSKDRCRWIACSIAVSILKGEKNFHFF